MKFSVLIPVYNTEKYLDDCVQSVLTQTYRDFEVILVDDGSTDSSPAICDQLAKEYPETVKVIHKDNAGPLSSRLVGIGNASGDYCIFVDSDDRISEDTLGVLANELEKYPDADVLIYSFMYTENGVPYKTFHSIADSGTVWAEDSKRELYEKLIFSNDVTPMWVKAVRCSLAKSDPTDYTIYYGRNMGEDILQSLYLLTAAKKVKYIYTPLYLYEYNEKSISRNYSPESVKKMNTIHVYEKIKEYLPLWGMDDESTKKKLNASWLNYAMYLFVKAYESASNRRVRDALLSFDWDSMIPNSDVDSYKHDVNPTYIRLYNLYKNGKNGAIHRFFIKNSIYKKYKSLKMRK